MKGERIRRPYTVICCPVGFSSPAFYPSLLLPRFTEIPISLAPPLRLSVSPLKSQSALLLPPGNQINS